MRQFIVCAAICTVAMCLCCTRTPLEDEIRSVSFNVEPFKVIEEDGSYNRTRTNFLDDGTGTFLWASGDTVGIYPNTGSQVYFKLNVGNDATHAEFDGGGWEFKAGSTYYSYYPFIGNIYLKRDHIPVSYLGQKQVGTSDHSHIGPFDFMYSPGVPVQGGDLDFSYSHLSCIIRLRVVLPAGTYKKLAITAPGQSFITKGYYNLTSSQPVIIPTEHSNQLMIDLESITTTGNSSEFVVYLMSAPVDLTGTQITVSVLNSERKEFQCTKTPSYAYTAGSICKLGCTSFTEVSQSMGLIIDDWGDGGNIGGNAN